MNQMTKQIDFEVHFFHFETKSHLDIELVRSEIKLQSCNLIMKQVVHLHLVLLFPRYVSRINLRLDLEFSFPSKNKYASLIPSSPMSSRVLALAPFLSS
jgi:hypothetical protein